MAETAIEWTEVTWNPTTGCDKISAGCDHCYALTMAKRLKAMGQAKYQNDGDLRTSGPGFGLTVHEDALKIPYGWTKPTLVFVNSMSDLFHARVPLDFVRRVFEVIADTPQHTYQVLTKRSTRLRRVGESLNWPPNLWMGVSVENAEQAYRIDDLRLAPAQVRFLSCEPLIGPLGDIDLAGIHWVIGGGESGPGARPMHPFWARSLRDQCQAAAVPFFFKQWGAWAPRGRLRDGEPLPADNDRTLILNVDGATRGRAAGSLTNHLSEFSDGSHCEVMENVGKKAAGRLLDGTTWDEFPQPAEVAR